MVLVAVTHRNQPRHKPQPWASSRPAPTWAGDAATAGTPSPNAASTGRESRVFHHGHAYCRPRSPASLTHRSPDAATSAARRLTSSAASGTSASGVAITGRHPLRDRTCQGSTVTGVLGSKRDVPLAGEFQRDDPPPAAGIGQDHQRVALTVVPDRDDLTLRGVGAGDQSSPTRSWRIARRVVASASRFRPAATSVTVPADRASPGPPRSCSTAAARSANTASPPHHSSRVS